MLRGERSLKEAAATLCSALAQLGDFALEDELDAATAPDSLAVATSGMDGSGGGLHSELCSQVSCRKIHIQSVGAGEEEMRQIQKNSKPAPKGETGFAGMQVPSASKSTSLEPPRAQSPDRGAEQEPCECVDGV